jgi:hypothetical protein
MYFIYGAKPEAAAKIALQYYDNAPALKADTLSLAPIELFVRLST